MEKVLRYLGYASTVIGLSMLAFVWVYYATFFSASIGVVTTDHVLYGYIEETTIIINLSLADVYNRILTTIVLLGILGGILTYIGVNVVPRVLKEYKIK